MRRTTEQSHVHVVGVDDKQVWVVLRAGFQASKVGQKGRRAGGVVCLLNPFSARVVCNVHLKGSRALELELDKEGGEGTEGGRWGGEDKGLEGAVAVVG